MKDKKEVAAFYARLKNELDKTTKFPALYLYKFIVPTIGTGIQQIQDSFDNTGAVIVTKQSSNGKYTSVSVEVKMKNSDAVIEKYQQVSAIEGIISL